MAQVAKQLHFPRFSGDADTDDDIVRKTDIGHRLEELSV